MLSGNVLIGILFISQTCIGISGNLLLLLAYVYISLIDTCQKKATDNILTHLTFYNMVIIICRGIPEVMCSFGIKNILDDVGCKAVIFIYRVARGLAICSTCLLSIFQATTISTSNCVLLWLKPKISNVISSSFLFFWVLNMLLNSKYIRGGTAPKNVTFPGHGFPLKYCITGGPHVVLLTVIFTNDILFVFLMAWASIYMVRLLHRHQKKVQSWHKSKKTQKISPENRATQTILCLVTCFVFFHLINSFLVVHLSFSPHEHFNLQSISVFFSSCYSMLCPLVLISSDRRISRVLCALTKRRNCLKSR